TEVQNKVPIQSQAPLPYRKTIRPENAVSAMLASGPPATMHAYREGWKSAPLVSGLKKPQNEICRSNRKIQLLPDLISMIPPTAIPPASRPTDAPAMR